MNPFCGRETTQGFLYLSFETCQKGMILWMVQKSGDHQLRLVVYPIVYKVLAPSQVVVWDF